MGSTLYPPTAPTFKPAFWQDLAVYNPWGAELDERDVRDWFYLVAWLRYRTYDYGRHRSMIQRWWARATLAEVRQAREIRLRKEGVVPAVYLPSGVRPTRPPPANERPQERGPRQRRYDSPSLLGDILAKASESRRS